MPTPRGRSVLALLVGLGILGRTLAMRELQMAAAGIIAIVATSLATVLLRRASLRASRRLTRSRATVGDVVTVELRLEYNGPFRSGPVLLEDTITPSMGPAPHLAAPSLAHGRSVAIEYDLHATRRGLFSVGPLEATPTDPFGLFVRRSRVAGHAPLIVYPAHDRIETLPVRVRRAGVVRRSPLIGHGEEFYALRDYRDGDDLRKVHWPTSLRLGELFVRQDELLQEPGVLIVLDNCEAKHRGDGAGASFEAAVSAAASLGTLAIRLGLAVDVICATGTLLKGWRPTRDGLLEGLALVQTSPVGSMAGALTRAKGGESIAAVVVVTPGLDAAEAGAVARLATRAAGGAVVLVDAETFDPLHRPGGAVTAAGALDMIGLPAVRLARGDTFRDTWESRLRVVSLAR